MKCPICNLHDQVQKVSAIVYSATNVTNGTGNAVIVGTTGNNRLGVAGAKINTTSTSSSVLAQKLSLPQYKKEEAGWVLPIIIFVVSHFLLSSMINGMNFFSEVLVFIGIPLLVALMVLGYRQEMLDKKNEAEPKKYETASQIWYGLDYCHRCDVVFSENGNYVRSDQINELLFPSTPCQDKLMNGK